MSRFAHYLSVQTHGGRCCGIKTIWNFPYSPNDSVSELKKKKFRGDVDYYGRGVTKAYDFMSEARPREPAKDRLKAVIDFIKKKRPAGLIEVTLTKFQAAIWRSTLESHGFKEVSTFKNSNTSRTTIIVFHLVYDTGGY